MPEIISHYSHDLIESDNNGQDKFDFNYPPLTDSAIEVMGAIEKLRSESEVDDSFEIHKKETIIGDGSHIEGQQISLLESDTGLKLSFKLTKDAHEAVVDRFNTELNPELTEIDYFGKSITDNSPIKITATPAHTVEVDGFKISISEENPSWKTVKGSVQIEIPEADQSGRKFSSSELAEKLDIIMSTTLGINEAFTDPDREAENNYKTARYNWHHKIDETDIDHDTLDRLTRSEVFPGYSTIVETGKHLKYKEKYGEFSLTHRVSDASNLPKLIQHGIMSTHERFKRGIRTFGICSSLDMETGGADSVFVRTATETSVADRRDDARIYNDATIILKPELTDRTDWYAYDSNMKGSTDPEVFEGRLSPDSLFSYINESGYRNTSSNEQMYRTGIPTEMFAGIATPNRFTKLGIVQELHNAGIDEVNSIPVEDFIHVTTNISQTIDIANNRPPRASRSTQVNLGKTALSSHAEIKTASPIAPAPETQFTKPPSLGELKLESVDLSGIDLSLESNTKGR